MKNIWTLIAFFCMTLTILQGQQRENFNLELISQVDYEEECNDIWGYVDSNGVEYAILGTTRATAIISLEDPANPREIAYIPGANSIWRDMKSFNNHVYVTADQGFDGILSIDMSLAPDSISWTYSNPEANHDEAIGTIDRCHNLYIDEDGYIYLSGCNINSGGIVILEPFQDPNRPTVVGAGDARYSHDVYVQDSMMYSSDILEGFFSVVDVRDRTNPVTIATNGTSFDFTHNAWLSDDGRYLFTTDERPNAFTDAYDISDLGNIRRLDTWRPRATEGLGVIPHNTHFFNNYLVTSHYTDGVKIVDVHRPHNMVEVGSYDSFLGEDGGFNGCWGAYPYLPSGLLLASDMQSGLLVLDPNYQRAAYLEGEITNADNGNPINNAEVTLAADLEISELSTANGSYAMGQEQTGTFNVTVTHPEYFPWEGEAELISGEVTVLNVELEPKPSFFVDGTVLDAISSEPIANAQVIFELDGEQFMTETDASGLFNTEVLLGTGTLTAGLWGYNSRQIDISVQEDNSYEIMLEPGYKDDFFFDFGWESSGLAVNGQWVREKPIGTFSGPFLANPDSDLPDDLGDKMYITGNEGGNPQDDDVDFGEVILTSPPMDFTPYDECEIKYSLWFFEQKLESATEDSLIVYLENGQEEIVLQFLTESTDGFEEYSITDLSERIEFTESMRIRLYTADREFIGHIVEAGLDGFEVIGSIIESTDNVSPLVGKMTINPNPLTDVMTVQLKSNDVEGELRVYSMDGRLVERRQIDGLSPNVDIVTTQWNEGTYLVRWLDSQGRQIDLQKALKISAK